MEYFTAFLIIINLVGAAFAANAKNYGIAVFSFGMFILMLYTLTLQLAVELLKAIIPI